MTIPGLGATNCMPLTRVDDFENVFGSAGCCVARSARLRAAGRPTAGASLRRFGALLDLRQRPRGLPLGATMASRHGIGAPLLMTRRRVPAIARRVSARVQRDRRTHDLHRRRRSVRRRRSARRSPARVRGPGQSHLIHLREGCVESRGPAVSGRRAHRASRRAVRALLHEHRAADRQRRRPARPTLDGGESLGALPGRTLGMHGAVVRDVRSDRGRPGRGSVP